VSSPPRKALITGITGQDGSYLTELLLEKGYEVHGLVRRTSTLERSRLSHLFADETIYNRRLFLHYSDIQDVISTQKIIYRVQPDEFYHLAGQSHVGLSFEIPETTCDLTAMGTLRLLEIIRGMDKAPRFLHAGSSEIFGAAQNGPQTEATPHHPVTPYGVAKEFAVQMTALYREQFALWSCNAIAYNHESPRRGENFVSRKICRAAAEIKLGRRTEIKLGNIDGARDWSDARDIVAGYHLILQHGTPGDFILASGVQHTVKDILEIAFRSAGLDWQKHVVFDPALMRPSDPNFLTGDATRARTELGWRPAWSFEDTIRSIYESEYQLLSVRRRSTDQ